MKELKIELLMYAGISCLLWAVVMFAFLESIVGTVVMTAAGGLLIHLGLREEEKQEK